MPHFESSFSAPFWLRAGHLQTVLRGLIWTRGSLCFERQTLELSDGDFLSLGWHRSGSRKLAILCHGLEGSMDAVYIRSTGAALFRAGWDVLAWNFRGCGSIPNRLLAGYHCGKTEDLASVIRHSAPHYLSIALVGFSLGGNLVLKYLGEAAPHPKVSAAVAVSAPVDLGSTAEALDCKFANRIYLRRFLSTLNAKMKEKRKRFPDRISDVIARSLREFDDIYTAPLHGFSGATDYWARSSSRQFLEQITVRCLLLNAVDDPFLAEESFPWEEAHANPCFFIETPAHGGHLGFMDWRGGPRYWLESRIVEFLDFVDAC
jgi:predicted alpha/beta-fold hydrolase